MVLSTLLMTKLVEFKGIRMICFVIAACNLTVKVPVVGMCGLDMKIQHALEVGTVVTIFTFESLLRLLVPHLIVRFKISMLSCGVITLITFEGLLPSMNSVDMMFQVFLAPDPL